MAHRFDFLVIGSGVAGLTFALRAAEHGSVAIVTKKDSAESNTNHAQGGIAAVMDPTDDVEAHVRDTLEVGAGLCDEDVVRLVVAEGPRAIRELMELGARFNQRSEGLLELGREGGHSANRIVHAGDRTGREIERTLLTAVRTHPGIEVCEHHFVVDLLTQHQLGVDVSTLDDGEIECHGAYVLDSETNRVETFLAKATLLASGGAGQVYLHTTNPRVATGDGVAMAYRARARIADLEFVQFHPTSLHHPGFEPGGRAFLISEAVRGEGGILLNHRGERFMPLYDSRGELAPRDVVARAIDDQMKRHGEEHVWLDVTHLDADRVRLRFPHINETLTGLGIDIAVEPIPVVPAAHYFCGGVVVDAWARTSIAGLFACGEVARTGLHGANRLASNSLLEAMVFAPRAVESAVEAAESRGWKDDVPEWEESSTEDPEDWVLVAHNRQELRRVMSNYVGIVRSTSRLRRAARRIQMLHEETEAFYQRTRISAELCELRNMINVAHLIVEAALHRTESVGLHTIVD